MEKEIVYKRSRRDITMYLLLSLIADLGCIYAIQVNSTVVGFTGLIIFGICTIYLTVRLIIPNTILVANDEGIKTKYTKGKYIPWDNISEIYIDMDSYKDKPVNVIAINTRKEDEPQKSIKFPNPKNKVRGDHNVNLQYSDGNVEEALKEIKKFYKVNIK